jgi:two-component system, LytTR family, response regulator
MNTTNNPISCLVVDDEIFSVNMLSNYVRQTSFLQLSFATTQPLEAVKWLGEHTVQLCITDVNMPSLSGLELIDATTGPTKFILCTAHSQYALDGFNYDVVDYLLKPVTYPRFLKAVQKARQLLLPAMPLVPAEALFIGSKGRYERIPFEEIFCMEINKNYITIHLKTRKAITHGTMKELLPQLPAGFLRVHNSHVIRLTAIKTIDGNIITLGNDEKVPIGPTFRAALNAALQINS